MEENIPTYKVILIGDMGVGKTSLLRKFINGKYDPNSLPTIGVDLGTKILDIDNNQIKGQFWDTAGQEKYKSITSQ